VNTDAMRIAREALGMSQTDLARASGLEQSDISRWERGLRAPSDEQLAALAMTLRVPTALLLDEMRPAQPVHRTQRAETKRIERMVNGRLELARMAASRLLADVNIDTPFAFPTPDEPAPPDPEAAAEAIRRVWRVPPGPLGDLATLVESAGAVVLPADFGVDSILAAYAHPRGDQRWCFLNTRSIDGARARFSLAHELGHALLHWDRFDAPADKDAEREAHRFAAALLMPREAMTSTFGRSRITLDDLVVYRQRWGVSVQALVTRSRDIGLITADQHLRLYKQISARGWRRSEPGHVPLERPSILAEALRIQRDEHGYSDAELADLAGLSMERLADLMPDHFQSPGGRRPVLTIVT
jgi:Zn-dependent peptidase ImmA (M78 family)/DNA-binding XRE family transcriptional regulator